MFYFKDQNDGFYSVASLDVRLPEGCVQITEAQAEALRPVAPELTYAQKRAPLYPPITDYLDGIAKGDTAQVNAYIAACLAVKAKYPKA